VFSPSIARVSSVKTHLIYCQLKWRHVSTQGVIIRPIIEPCLRYIKWKCPFGTPKCLQHCDNVYTIEVDVYNIIYNKKGYIVLYIILLNINLNCTHVLTLLSTFLDPKNVHFHLMYVKHGSIIGLMMTPWVETCRHFNWQ